MAVSQCLKMDTPFSSDYQLNGNSLLLLFNSGSDLNFYYFQSFFLSQTSNELTNILKDWLLKKDWIYLFNIFCKLFFFSSLVFYLKKIIFCEKIYSKIVSNNLFNKNIIFITLSLRIKVRITFKEGFPNYSWYLWHKWVLK